MNGWLLSLGVAAATSVAGLLGAGWVGSMCVVWYRISSFEGRSGFFVIQTALAGGILAGIGGLLVSRGVAVDGVVPFPKALGLALAGVAGAIGVAAATARVLADVPPTASGKPLEIEVEFRLPAGVARPSLAPEASLTVGAGGTGTRRSTRQGVIRATDLREEAGRWIVPGTAPLFSVKRPVTLAPHPPLGDPAGFLVSVPSPPDRSLDQWSDWLPKPRPGDPPWPEDRLSYRFRIRVENSVSP